MRAILACLLASLGCVKATPSYVPQIAVAVGVASLASPVPTPAPDAERCVNCNGKGWLGDGVVMRPCPECNADEHIPKPAKESPKQITIVVKKQDNTHAPPLAKADADKGRVLNGDGPPQPRAKPSKDVRQAPNYVWRQVPVRTCNRYGGCTTFYQWQLVPAR